MEEELENERKLRQKSEMQRKDLEAQLDELQDQLETAGGATNAQVNQITEAVIRRCSVEKMLLKHFAKFTGK